METIKLPNGIEEAKPLYMVTMVVLKNLAKEQPTAFYDLVMMCRDKDYKAWGNNGDILKDLRLLEANGRPHDSIENIVNAVVKGDGLEMSIEPLSN